MAILATRRGDGRVSFEWDAATDPAHFGYRLFYGVSSGVYPWFVDVGNTTRHKIHGLPIYDAMGNRLTFYGCAQSYDSSGTLIGSPSNESSGPVQGPT